MVGLLAQVATATAIAEPAASPGAHDRAAAAFEAGRTWLARHQPTEACASFTQAVELEPGNVGVLLNLGLCNQQLDKLATALTWFRAALARASGLGLAESTRAASDQIAALSRAVPVVQIAVSPPAAAGAVTIDGAAVRAADLGRVELDAGHHVVALATAGGATVQKQLDLVDGAATPVELVEPRAGLATPGAGPADAAQRVAGARVWVYLAGGIGGGLVLGGAVLGLAGRSAARSTDHPDVQRDWKLAVRYGGTSMFVAGAAGLGWAIWTYVRAPDEHADRLAVAPIVGDHAVGLGARRAF